MWRTGPTRQPQERLIGPSVCFRLLFCAVGLALCPGCQDKDVRQLERLPAPRFHEPPTDWPTTAPAGLPTDEIEAGWRNHVLPDRQWRWIVVHHSSTPGGDAARFDTFHRDVRKWDELGYHFVIGNGVDSGDGRIEVGSRWLKQKHGAHCATPSRQFNDYGIGICIVGDFEQPDARPTPRQWASAVMLCRFLCREYGIGPERIVGHRQAQALEGDPNTECPGRNMDLGALRADIMRN